MQSNSLGPRDLERVSYVTRNYDDLQGLVWLPLGALLMVAGLFVAAGVTPEVETRLAGDLVALGGGALILALIVARILIQRHYRRRYGRVFEIESAFLRRYKIHLLVSLPLLAVVLALESVLVGISGFPLPGFLFAVMAAEAASWWPDRRFRRHWFLGGAALSACGAVSFAYELASGTLSSPDVYGFALALVGLYVVVSGILDHRLLSGTVKDAPEGRVD